VQSCWPTDSCMSAGHQNLAALHPTRSGSVEFTASRRVPLFKVRVLSDAMEQSCCWEANVNSASQEITRLLLDPKVTTVFTTARHWFLTPKVSQNFVYISHFLTASYISCPYHHLITLMTLGEGYKLWSSSLCNFLQCFVTASLRFIYSPQRLVLTLEWETK